METRQASSTLLAEVRNLLEKYNGIPSQTADRNAYAKIKYVLKSYSEDPLVVSLIQEFSIKKGGCRNNPEAKAKEMEESLVKYGSYQNLRYDKTLYNRIYKYTDLHLNHQSVLRLAYIYGFYKLIPIPNSQYGKEYDYSEVIVRHITPSGLSSVTWKINVTLEYIEYVFAKYHELPNPKTNPMRLLSFLIREYKAKGKLYNDYLKDDLLLSFLKKMKEKGCNDEIICSRIISDTE